MTSETAWNFEFSEDLQQHFHDGAVGDNYIMLIFHFIYTRFEAGGLSEKANLITSERRTKWREDDEEGSFSLYVECTQSNNSSRM